MRAGRGQFDVPQALSPHLRQRDFYAALVADHAAVLHALVLAAETLPVGDRPEDAGAEQTIAFRFKSSIVDGFGLCHLAMRPAPDFLRRGHADADRVEICDRICQVKWARTEQGFLHFLRPYRCRQRLRIQKSSGGCPLISSLADDLGARTRQSFPSKLSFLCGFPPCSQFPLWLGFKTRYREHSSQRRTQS